MNNSTNIAYEEVQNAANTIKECSRKMNNIFTDFEQSMNQVNSADTFEGQASEALKARFQSLKGKFDSYTSKVEAFANLISSAGEATNVTEKSIASAADELGH